MLGLMISACIWMRFGEINHPNNAAVVQKPMKELWQTEAPLRAKAQQPTRVSGDHVWGLRFPGPAVRLLPPAELSKARSLPFSSPSHRVEVHWHGSPLLLSAELHRLSDPPHGRGPRSHVRGQQRLHPFTGSE